MSWTVLILSALLGPMFGPSLNLPDVVLNLPPSTHAPKMPLEGLLPARLPREHRWASVRLEYACPVFGGGMGGPRRLPRQIYERELLRLQEQLMVLQEWVRAEGARVAVVFEGRDAAGKGSTIKRVTEYLNPRVARIVALPAPTDRERTQWYFQRYVEHLPAAGEIVLFDRSWYNRAGVERVMGFCTGQEYRRFLHQCPIFERMLVEDGILLNKYWFSVSDAEQERRFRSRLDDPMRRWKLSAMDLESISRWEEYSRAKDEMFVHTDIPEAPWYVVDSDDKRRARINMISHLLSSIPYREMERPPLQLPHRPPPKGYERPPRDEQTYVPDRAATLQR
ncbi:polyphosphate kinase 2 [Actinomadura sp. GTD37]|uniref:polyphosphate kinase 2 n=1 Tax=Actinomadura sp. GTD37 TaxID=1778030 RepID=UPI0035C248EB